jgi:hypothetical protein
MDFTNFIFGRQQLVRWTQINQYKYPLHPRATEATYARRIFASLLPSSSFPSLQFNPSAPLTGPMSDSAGDEGRRPWQDGVEKGLRHHMLEKM